MMHIVQSGFIVITVPVSILSANEL